MTDHTPPTNDHNTIREDIHSILRRHHFLPTADDIRDALDKTPTDVLDTASATKALTALFKSELKAIQSKLPEKKNTANEKMLFREAHQRLGFNYAIDQVNATIEAAIGDLSK